MKKLEKSGYRVDYLKVNNLGIVDLIDLKKKLSKETILVSLMHVNNDIGTIQPIKEAVKIVKAKSNALVHSDGVQAEAALFPDLKDINVDAYTFSAHKFNGPKGISVIYLKDNKRELNDLETGTQNTPLIVGMATSLEKAFKYRFKEQIRLKNLSIKLIHTMLSKIKDIILLGEVSQKIPGITSFAIKGIHRDRLVLGLNEKGFAVSAGAACASQDIEASYVLKAMNVHKNYLNGSLRISLGRYNKANEIALFVKAINDLLKETRGY